MQLLTLIILGPGGSSLECKNSLNTEHPVSNNSLTKNGIPVYELLLFFGSAVVEPVWESYPPVTEEVISPAPAPVGELLPQAFGDLRASGWVCEFNGHTMEFHINQVPEATLPSYCHPIEES